jgi:hypothetical protein
MEGAGLRELALRFGRVAECLVNAAEAVMGIGLSGIEFYGVLKRFQCLGKLLLLHAGSGKKLGASDTAEAYIRVCSCQE